MYFPFLLIVSKEVSHIIQTFKCKWMTQSFSRIIALSNCLQWVKIILETSQTQRLSQHLFLPASALQITRFSVAFLDFFTILLARLHAKLDKTYQFLLSVTKTCPLYAHSMSTLCPLYAYSMPTICSLYAYSMLTLCPLYAHYMPMLKLAVTG